MGHKNNEVEDGKIFAFLGVFLVIVGFIIVLLAKRDNKYAMYYAKQGLVLFIAYLIAFAVGIVIGWMPFIGRLIIGVMVVIWIALWIIGTINSLSGEMKEIPLIGQFAEKIKV